MNLNNKLKQIEQRMNINTEFCRCGTSYFNEIIAGKGCITTEICPDCERKVKPQTIAEFVRDANFQTELILPALQES